MDNLPKALKLPQRIQKTPIWDLFQVTLLINLRTPK